MQQTIAQGGAQTDEHQPARPEAAPGGAECVGNHQRERQETGDEDAGGGRPASHRPRCQGEGGLEEGPAGWSGLDRRHAKQTTEGVPG